MVKWTITVGDRQMLLRNVMTPKKDESHVRASLRTNARSTPFASNVGSIQMPSLEEITEKY